MADSMIEFFFHLHLDIFTLLREQLLKGGDLLAAS
jgi:hypothetical protein